MKHIQPSESLANGLLLAFAGGMMDAYTYLCRGQVFANAETGNLVLLGIQLAQRNWGRALYYLWPIMSFALGVLLTEWLRSHFTPLPGLPHWRQLVLVVECGGLLLVSLLPVGPLDWLANVIVSFVSAMQIESFRKFEGNPFSTTMCTGNLRSGTEKLYRCLFLRETRAGRGAQDYYSVILLFVLGALVGGLCADLLAGRSILFACLPLSLAFLLMLREPQ